MKKIILYLSICTSIFGLESCREEFLETVPTADISSVSVTETADNMMLAINGMHRSMYTRQNSNQGQNGHTAMMIRMDALGDDLIFPTTGNGWFMSTIRWQDHRNENGSDALYPWRFYYMLIRNANVLITGGQNATGDESLKRNALGQAYAFRAFGHFQLVQLYAKRYDASTANANGIPLRLTPEDNPIERSSVEAVYAQIKADLDKAEELLTNVTRIHKSHFNINVVKGLKARVALTMGDYSTAATEARSARNGFALMDATTYKAGFNSLANGEWIWGCEVIADQTDYFGNFGAYMSRNYNSTNIRTAPKAVSPSLYSKFPKTDVRTQVIDPTGQHTSLALPRTYSKYPYTSQKFLAVSTSDSRMDIPFMRAAEMYLIEAEALARNGQESNSKAVFLEFTQKRNPSYTSVTSTGKDYITEIMESRRLELWGEGFRFFDLKRLNLPLERNTSEFNSTVVANLYNVPAGDTKWQFLIPRRELDSNPLIKQND